MPPNLDDLFDTSPSHAFDVVSMLIHDDKIVVLSVATDVESDVLLAAMATGSDVNGVPHVSSIIDVILAGASEPTVAVVVKVLFGVSLLSTSNFFFTSSGFLSGKLTSSDVGVVAVDCVGIL